jgi:hypothetical protein
MGRDAAGFRFLPGALGALMALGEDALHGQEKTPAHEIIKKKKDYDRGDGREKQIAELV